MKVSKKNLIIIISVVLVIILTLSLTLGLLMMQLAKKYNALFDRAREILLQNFNEVELGAKQPLKRVINNENPLNLVNYYGDEPLEDLWESIPSSQKPYTMILLIPGQVLKYDSEQALKNLESWADKCESKQIPYVIQNINGETHMEYRPPIAYLEERFAKRHQYFYGLNAAELYNGVDWRGESESDNSLYIIQNIKLCAKYGGYFMWTDTNRNYESGMLLEWLEKNESFYSTFKNYSDYFCLLNKESYGHPSTYAVMQGLWLAGLAGNWGVASDWWHWQVDGDKQSLFGENDDYVEDEWEMIFSYPENMYVQSMMLVMSRGGTCFKAEAPNFSTSYGGKPLAGFAYGISPLLERIINGSISIPNKEQVLQSTDFAVLGKQNYSKANYDYNESNLYPKQGASGIVPLLPKNLRLAERKVFLDKGIRLIDYPLSDSEFMSLFKTNDANTYLTRVATDWYYIHNVENERKVKYASFSPVLASAEKFYIESEEHTSAIISEKVNGFNVYISNYRTDKTNMFKEGTPKERENLGWAKYVSKYLSLDDKGNPIGVDDMLLRTTTLKITGEYAGGKPQLVFNNAIDGSGNNNRAFNYAESYDQSTKELVVTINHNGIIDLTVLLDESGEDYQPTSKLSIAESINTNTNAVDSLIALTQEKLTNSHDYTYFSYLEYDKAFEKAVVMINERTYSATDIESARDRLVEAKDNLINISNAREVGSKAISKDNRSKKINKAIDMLLMELTSSKKYVTGRGNILTYAKNYKKSDIVKEITAKGKYIASRVKTLSNAIK